MASAVQLDLFGEVEAAERKASERRIAPRDTAAGPRPGDPPLKKGERSPVPGWRCPDPECGGEMVRWTSPNEAKDGETSEIFYKCIRCLGEFRGKATTT